MENTTITVRPEVRDLLKKYAKRQDISIKKFVQILVNNYILTEVQDELDGSSEKGGGKHE